MIRKNSLKIKLIHLKKSTKFIFQTFMRQFRPEMETCPCCNSKGNCHIHSYYERNIIDYQDGHVRSDRIRILRVICSSCNRTHAILPDILIPYLSYGIRFILQVLADYFAHSASVESICEKYGIYPKLLYKWIASFRSHKELWLGILEHTETSSCSFLDSLRADWLFSDFSSGFALKYGFSFLQTHSNFSLFSARYHQTCFDPDYLVP